VKGLGGIEAFTVEAIELAGGVVERSPDGLHTVLWPVPRSGEVTLRQLAFDPELLDEAPYAELVSFASPTLERLLRGTTAARAFLDTVVTPSRSLVDQLRRAYRFLESAWTPQGGRPWWLPTGLFLFRVRYLSDAREEDLLEVAVNLTDRRLLRRLQDALDRHRLVADPIGCTPRRWMTTIRRRRSTPLLDDGAPLGWLPLRRVSSRWQPYYSGHRWSDRHRRDRRRRRSP
jgi:hypothetical protein